MKEWEYTVIAHEDSLWSLTQMLNNMGSEGWELCTDIGGWLFFKREKEDA